MGQSYNWTALNNKIDTMTPNGNTNQAIGLAWGWQSLTQSAPFNAPALDPNYQYQQIIILLTDGLNTQDRWYTKPDHSIDARQQITCNNIKAAGITVYTVQVDINNARSDLDPAAELRERRQQVLPADEREPDHHDLRHHRHQPRAAAPVEVSAAGARITVFALASLTSGS